MTLIRFLLYTQLNISQLNLFFVFLNHSFVHAILLDCIPLNLSEPHIPDVYPHYVLTRI